MRGSPFGGVSHLQQRLQSPRVCVLGGNRSHQSLCNAFLHPGSSRSLLAAPHPHSQPQSRLTPTKHSKSLPEHHSWATVLSLSPTPVSSEALLLHTAQDRWRGCCSPGCPEGQELQDEVRQEEVGALGWREGRTAVAVPRIWRKLIDKYQSWT